MTTETPATKIVIVAGQEFSVSAETDNETIRQQLVSMGFADVATAKIEEGKRTAGEQELITVEFVKKAGTKGLSGAELAALLREVPRASVATATTRLAPAQRRVLHDLASGAYTFASAAAAAAEIEAALDAAEAEMYHQPSHEGAQLCSRVEPLSAAAAPSCPSGW